MNFKSASLFFLMFMMLGMQAIHAQSKKKKENKEVDTEDKAPGAISDPRKSEYYLAEAQKYFILEDYAKAFVLYQKARQPLRSSLTRSNVVNPVWRCISLTKIWPSVRVNFFNSSR